MCPCGCHSGNKREVGLCQQATGGRGRPKKKNNNKKAKLGDGTKKATVNLQKPWWYLHNADLGGTFRSHVLEFCGLPPGTPKICPNCEDRWKRQTRKHHGAAIKEQAEAKKKAACRWAAILDVQCTSVSQYLVIFRYSVMHCSYLTQTPSAPALAIQKNLGRQTQPNEPPDLRYLPCVMQRRILIFHMFR